MAASLFPCVLCALLGFPMFSIAQCNPTHSASLTSPQLTKAVDTEPHLGL